MKIAKIDERMADALARLGRDFAMLVVVLIPFLVLYPSIPNFLKTLLHVAAVSTAAFLLSPLTLMGVFLVWWTLFIFDRRKAYWTILATFSIGTLALVSGLWGGLFFVPPSAMPQVIHLATLRFTYENAYAIGFSVVMAMGVGVGLVRVGTSFGWVLWSLIQPVVNKWVESLVARMRSLLHISA